MNQIKNYLDNKPFTYNSERPDILFREYGRHIQSLVTHILEEENKENRTRKAYLVIELMRQLNPALKDLPDAQQKLWDHLHIMADFQLDVEAPYPAPNKEELFKAPEPLEYTQHKVKYKHYGKNIEQLIEKVKEVTDETERYQAAIQVARLMKTFYAEWNKETIEDEVIVRQLKEMSDGLIQLDLNAVKEEELLDIKSRRAAIAQIGHTPKATHATKSSNHSSNNKKDKKRNKKRR
jgi:hypothetical protein